MKKACSFLNNLTDELGLCSVAWKTKDGKFDFTTKAICFAPFHVCLEKQGISQLYMGVRQAFTPDQEWFLTPEQQKIFKKYIKFIMQESIFKDAFITKRICDAKRYGIEMDVSVAGNITLAAMICIRRGWELVTRLNAWNFLVENGVCPHIALALSNFLSYNLKTNKMVLLDDYERDRGHEAFYFKNVREGLLSVRRGVRRIEKPYCVLVENNYTVFQTTKWSERREDRIPNTSNAIFVSIPTVNRYSVVNLDINATLEKILIMQKEFYA